jgi:hypothetical protein
MEAEGTEARNGGGAECSHRPRTAARPVRGGTARQVGRGAAPVLLAAAPRPPRRIGYVLQRGCRAPARRVLGRRVRYVIGCEPGQVQGMRWRPRHGAGPRA